MKRGWVAVLAGAVVLVLITRVVPDVPVDEPAVDLPWREPLVQRDLDAVLADTLRVLVMEDPLTWEPWPSGPRGTEYELLRRFAEVLQVPMRVVPHMHLDSLFAALQRGEGDIAAAQLTPRRDHRRWLAFSRPYRQVAPVVAMLRNDPLMPAVGVAWSSAVDSVRISRWSPFADPAYRFDRHLRHKVMPHGEPVVSPEELLAEAIVGRHAAVITTDARAHHGTDRLPVLEFGPPVGPSQPLAFALRRNAPRLLKRINAWLGDEKEHEARAFLFDEHATARTRPGPLRQRKRIPLAGDSISPFDDAFRRHAAGMRWDWELLAAMAWRESRFDSTVTSRKGAQGILQLMPRTGARFGLDSTSLMDDHIAAAVRYLNRLDTLWIRAVPDKDQRTRFVLASYNAGPGHIIDAQRLAARLGLDPQRWEHHVERAVLLLAMPRYFRQEGLKNGYCRGDHVFWFVRDVTALCKALKERKRA